MALWRLDERTGTRRDSVGSNDLASIDNVGSVDGRISGAAGDLEPVRTWVDSVSNLSFTQPTFARRPSKLAASSTLDFDGNDDALSAASGAVVGNRPAFTCLAKLRLDTLPASGTSVVFAEEDATAGVQFRIGVNAAGNPNATYRGVGGTSATVTAAATVPTGGDHVVAVRRGNGTLDLFLDGAKVGSVPVGPEASLAGATVTVGGPTATANSSNLDGRLRHLFAIGRDVTDADIVALSNWFAGN